MKTKFDFVKTPGYNPVILGDPTLTPLSLMPDPFALTVLLQQGKFRQGRHPKIIKISYNAPPPLEIN